MARKPHVLLIPCPGQGHVSPLMKLGYKLADRGIKVTFVNTEFIHFKIMAAMPEKVEELYGVRFVAIPDGLEFEHDRRDLGKLLERRARFMPGHLKNLIEKINHSGEDEQISWVISDVTIGWALEVAKEMGIKTATFSPAGLASMAILLSIPKLIDAGVLDDNGISRRDESICLSDEIPAWTTDKLPWTIQGNPGLQKCVFHHHCIKITQTVTLSDSVLANSFHELEPSANHLFPNIMPIGPLLASAHESRHVAGSFWPEDQSCISWLDKQPERSVIYVAFGSIASHSQQQIEELALGLELTGRPFLWVVRPDLIDGMRPELPSRFEDRVADQGKVVEWASQDKVLSHSSTACFISHCGWNSTVEGVTMGVPFLCWPSFGDQIHNKKYICQTWKTGLELRPDEQGLVTRHEFETKVAELLSDDVIKENAQKLKEMARESVGEGGSSFKNFECFVEQLKHCYQLA